MLDKHGFDLWSKNYDDAVRRISEDNTYPFAGYDELISAVYRAVMRRVPSEVLDIGFGTAKLTSRLYNAGHHVVGIDFSEEMVSIAKKKMPDALLLCRDMADGIPPELDTARFDYIISTYAIHHLPDEAKVTFLKSLMRYLKPDGVILIGDVAFETRQDLLTCKLQCGSVWDDDEAYLVFSELRDSLADTCRVDFHPFSFCAGVLELRHPFYTKL